MRALDAELAVDQPASRRLAGPEPGCEACPISIHGEACPADGGSVGRNHRDRSGCGAQEISAGQLDGGAHRAAGGVEKPDAGFGRLAIIVRACLIQLIPDEPR